MIGGALAGTAVSLMQDPNVGPGEWLRNALIFGAAGGMAGFGGVALTHGAIRAAQLVTRPMSGWVAGLSGVSGTWQVPVPSLVQRGGRLAHLNLPAHVSIDQSRFWQAVIIGATGVAGVGLYNYTGGSGLAHASSDDRSTWSLSALSGFFDRTGVVGPLLIGLGLGTAAYFGMLRTAPRPFVSLMSQYPVASMNAGIKLYQNRDVRFYADAVARPVLRATELIVEGTLGTGVMGFGALVDGIAKTLPSWMIGDDARQRQRETGQAIATFGSYLFWGEGLPDGKLVIDIPLGFWHPQRTIDLKSWFGISWGGATADETLFTKAVLERWGFDTKPGAASADSQLRLYFGALRRNDYDRTGLISFLMQRANDNITKDREGMAVVQIVLATVLEGVHAAGVMQGFHFAIMGVEKAGSIFIRALERGLHRFGRSLTVIPVNLLPARWQQSLGMFNQYVVVLPFYQAIGEQGVKTLKGLWEWSQLPNGETGTEEQKKAEREKKTEAWQAARGEGIKFGVEVGGLLAATGGLSAGRQVAANIRHNRHLGPGEQPVALFHDVGTAFVSGVRYEAKRMVILAGAFFGFSAIGGGFGGGGGSVDGSAMTPGSGAGGSGLGQALGRVGDALSAGLGVAGNVAANLAVGAGTLHLAPQAARHAQAQTERKVFEEFLKHPDSPDAQGAMVAVLQAHGKRVTVEEFRNILRHDKPHNESLEWPTDPAKGGGGAAGRGLTPAQSIALALHARELQIGAGHLLEFLQQVSNGVPLKDARIRVTEKDGTVLIIGGEHVAEYLKQQSLAEARRDATFLDKELKATGFSTEEAKAIREVWRLTQERDQALQQRDAQLPQLETEAARLLVQRNQVQSQLDRLGQPWGNEDPLGGQAHHQVSSLLHERLARIDTQLDGNRRRQDSLRDAPAKAARDIREQMKALEGHADPIVAQFDQHAEAYYRMLERPDASSRLLQQQRDITTRLGQMPKEGALGESPDIAIDTADAHKVSTEQLSQIHAQLGALDALNKARTVTVVSRFEI